MDTDKRCKGYVVGSDVINGKEVWKVKATKASDENQQYLNKKFEVVSTRSGISLITGLDVTFVVGSFGKHSILKAVEVDIA
jgi:hypothetical protein